MTQVATEQLNDFCASDQHGSAYAFVRLEDGAILKPAGFKSPAKGVRGWINDPASVAKACGPHGVAYLR